MRVRDVIERVTTLYNDKDYVRVTQREYFKFLDDAVRQLILSRPDAHVAHEVVRLSQGTQQTIPSEGYTLIDIYMNKKAVVDEQGVTTYQNYRPVWQVERKDLDYFDNWQDPDFAGVDYINEFAYDVRSPRVFWVVPFVGTTPVYVEMDYSYGVPQYGTMDSIAVEDIMDMEIPDIVDTFLNPIVSYMLSLLYSTDSTSMVDREVAQRYEASFYNALGLEFNAVEIVKPKIEDAEVAAAIRQGS